MLKVLVACEESQAVCKAFRELGHEAYSCDIQECSGGHPEWHVQGDAMPLLNGNCSFQTMDGTNHTQGGAMGFDYCVPTVYLHQQRRSVSALSTQRAARHGTIRKRAQRQSVLHGLLVVRLFRVRQNRN